MIDLKAFRKSNNLTQDELGAYISMKKSFISKIEHGKEKLPESKLQKLLNNDRGWDTTMIAGDIIEQAGGQNNIGKIAGDCSEVQTLRKEIEMLREQLAKAEAQNEQYWEMIKKLTSR